MIGPGRIGQGSGAVPEVLVVDDDPFIRLLVTDVLELEGYRVRTAVDGETAVFEYTSVRPDCVVLDVMMPGLDGLEVLRRIRAADGAAVPVVMLTAAGGPGSADLAWQGGVDFFLSKPFEPDQLVGVLQSLLADSPTQPRVGLG